MAKLPEYQNLNEKKTYFSQTVIETEEEFDNFYNSIQHNGQIWRGCNEAKYKILTSLQLYWIKNGKPNEIEEVLIFLKKMIQYFKIWNNSTLANYLGDISMEKVPYTIFSILRHYSVPTPITDWTEDMNVALYFMIDKCSMINKEKEIDQYFSLYYISKDHPVHEINSKNATQQWVKQNLDKLKSQNKNEENFEHNFSNAILISEELYFDSLEKNYLPVFKIHDNPNDKLKYQVRNNFNISNQKGLFVHNSEPTKSVEEYFYDKYMGLPLDEFSNNDKYILYQNRHINNFFSVEINKTLRHFIKNKLKEKGIYEEYIYPELNKMKADFEAKFGNTK
jgi:hypothetical protein